MTWYPHITVATIVEKENRFLLVEEWDADQLVLNQPAGHLEQGESLEQAALRETLEETGWQVQLEHVTGLYLYRSPANDVTYLRTCFLAQAIDQVSEHLDSDIERTVWMTRDEIAAAQDRWRSPLVLRCVDDYRAGNAIPLALIQSLL